MTRSQYGPAQLALLLGATEPTAEQAAVISATPGPMAVIAGAGSGKSETMAARLVWLVANGMVRPERVLGLTFTRKAAAELAQRVRVRLDGLRAAGLAAGAGPGAAPGVAGQAPGVAGQASAAALGRAALALGAAPGVAHQPPGAALGRAGLPGGAASGSGGPELAPGGAAPAPGSTGIPAAGPQAGDDLLGDPVISTYHAYAGRLVADHALREALEPSLRLITPAVAWQLAARVVASYDGPMDAISWTPASVTAAVLDLSGELADHLRPAADVRSAGEWLASRLAELPRPTALARKIIECQRTREQLLPLVAAYTAAKAAREVIDYGDQLALAARIAVNHPVVGAAERTRYQVVLLDEYQDTSHAQLVLLQALFGGGHPVTAVGDPCQSIYGWRGASAGNLRRFGTDFPPRGGGPAPVRQLSTSFRNTGRVLDAAAALQQGLQAAALGMPRLVAPPGRAGRGEVVCALLETAARRGAVGGRPDRPAAQLPVRRRAGRRRLAGRPGRCGAPVRHRGAVPQARAVPRAAYRDRGPWHPGRGGRARRPAHRARGAGRRRDAPGDARPGRGRRTGQAAHRAALADRAAGPGRARPPVPCAGQAGAGARPGGGPVRRTARSLTCWPRR